MIHLPTAGRIFMISVGAWAALSGMGGAQAAPCPCGKVIAYVDCAATTDGVGTKDKPYNSLGNIITTKFGPGSAIRLKRGSTCTGELSFKGSGSESEPIKVQPYGKGTDRPVINAGGADQAMRLDSQQYVKASGLELIAPGDGSAARRGVYVTAGDSGTMHGISLSGLDIHDVGGALPGKAANADPATGTAAGASGGIVFEAQGTTTPTAFDGVSVSGNRIHNTDRSGISVWSNWCRQPDVAPGWHPSCTEAWKPAKNVVIKNNLVSNVGGDGITLMTTDGAKVRGNTLEGFNERSAGGMGVSTLNAASSVIEGNEVSGGHTADGGMAFGVGNATAGTTVQNNVSHDNDGGFLRLAGAPDSPTKDFAVRGNISVNDKARAVSITGGPLTGGQIAGNTVHLDPTIDQLIVDSKTGEKLDVKFVDNLVARSVGAGTDKGTVGWNLEDPGFVVDHNMLTGVPIPSGATETVASGPKLLAPGATDALGYQVRQGSPTLGAGTPVQGLTGYPVSASRVPAGSPNLGAAQAPAAYPASLADTFNSAKDGKPEDWKVKGDVVIAPDPSGYTGNSLVLKDEAAATHGFPAGAGFLRVNARMRSADTTKPVSMEIVDPDGKPVASVGITDGHLTYSDDADLRVLPYTVPDGTWVRLSMLLRPETGSYDLSAGGTPLTSGQLRAGSGVASRLVFAGDKGATLAADDVLVFPESCPGPGTPAAKRIALEMRPAHAQ